MILSLDVIVRKCCIENDHKSNKLIRIHKDNLIIFWNQLDITNKKNENIPGYKWFLENVILRKRFAIFMSPKCTLFLQYCHYNRIRGHKLITSSQNDHLKFPSPRPVMTVTFFSNLPSRAITPPFSVFDMFICYLLCFSIVLLNTKLVYTF